jgi:hypothetical protein
MLNNELNNEIGNSLASGISLHKINDGNAKDIIDNVAEQYVNDRDFIWWWECLSKENITIDYDDGLGWNYFEKFIKPLEQQVYIVVTDDDPEPWSIYKGSLLAVIDLLNNMWRFEYFIIAEDLSWIIFDTHHNCLVIAGSLVGNAKELKHSLDSQKYR